MISKTTTPEDVPLELVGELASKITPKEWIAIYEGNLKGLRDRTVKK